MSTTFLRGLALIEMVGVDGPVGITELARRLGADKASVSRMVTAAARDGWLTRGTTGVELGPRLPIVGHHTRLSGVLREAQLVLDAVAGVTGLFAHAYLPVGRGIMPVLAAGRPPAGLPTPPRLEMPIWTVAAGRAIATLMTEQQLDELLPTGLLPFPGPLDELSRRVDIEAGLTSAVGLAPQPATRLGTSQQFLTAVEEVRRSGLARDHGEIHPLIHCIAAPWETLVLPAAISVIGHVNDIAQNTELIEAVLDAAVSPGATRDRIVLRAAEIAQATS